MSSSTSNRFSREIARITSLVFLAFEISFWINDLKNGLTKSMANMFSPMIMHVAFSSVNWGLNEKPILEKKAMDRSRFSTGRFTNICLIMQIFIIQLSYKLFGV